LSLVRAWADSPTSPPTTRKTVSSMSIRRTGRSRNPGSLRQPCGQAKRLPVRQQIHRPTGLDVDEHRAIGPSFACGVLTNRSRGRGLGLGLGQCIEQPQHRAAADGHPESRATRAPAQPRRVALTAARADRNRSVHLLCRRVSPGFCSTNVRRTHEDSGQKNRRTRSRRTTRHPPLGTSAGNRRQGLCTRVDSLPQSGHAAPAAVLQTSMRIASWRTSSDSTDTSTMDGNSRPSRGSDVSSTMPHCRPHQDRPWSFSSNFPEPDPSSSRHSSCAHHDGKRSRTRERTALVA
jgi:hypothetical protein